MKKEDASYLYYYLYFLDKGYDFFSGVYDLYEKTRCSSKLSLIKFKLKYILQLKNIFNKCINEIMLIIKN